MFPGPLLTVILTLAGQSYFYSHNPERQGIKPLLPVLKTLVHRGRGSNPRPPANETDALTTRQPWRSKRIILTHDSVGYLTRWIHVYGSIISRCFMVKWTVEMPFYQSMARILTLTSLGALLKMLKM